MGIVTILAANRTRLVRVNLRILSLRCRIIWILILFFCILATSDIGRLIGLVAPSILVQILGFVLLLLFLVALGVRCGLLSIHLTLRGRIRRNHSGLYWGCGGLRSRGY